MLFNKATSNSFRTCPFLQNALDQAIAGDVVILCPGTHGVCSTGGLEEGGSIMGNKNLNITINVNIIGIVVLTLRLLISYIYGAPSKARNANVIYIYGPTFGNAETVSLFAAQCFNTESMQRGFLCHICV